MRQPSNCADILSPSLRFPRVFFVFTYQRTFVFPPLFVFFLLSSPLFLPLRGKPGSTSSLSRNSGLIYFLRGNSPFLPPFTFLFFLLAFRSSLPPFNARLTVRFRCFLFLLASMILLQHPPLLNLPFFPSFSVSSVLLYFLCNDGFLGNPFPSRDTYSSFLRFKIRIRCNSLITRRRRRLRYQFHESNIRLLVHGFSFLPMKRKNFRKLGAANKFSFLQGSMEGGTR